MSKNFIPEGLAKPLLIGVSIVGLGVFGMYLKNKIEQNSFKPLEKEQFLRIYKQLRKQNYSVLKQVAMVASQIAAQFKQITPEMIKGYLEGPQSPIKVDQMFQKTIKKVSQANNITTEQFEFNMKKYEQDMDIKQLVNQSQREFQTALQGRIPNFPVKIPENLSKQKVIEVQYKIIRQKYLFQIGLFRKLRQYTKQQLAQNPELMKELPTPESEEQMLEEEGIGNDEQPASAVLHAAICNKFAYFSVVKYKSDQSFKQSLISTQNSFKNIYSRYESKINNNKISQAELNQLQDQIIYFQII